MLEGHLDQPRVSTDRPPSRDPTAVSTSAAPHRTALLPRIAAHTKPLCWLPVAFTASLVMAFLLRFDGVLDAQRQAQWMAALPLWIIVKTGVFAAARWGRMWHAFVSLHDGVRLLKTTAISSAAVAAADYLLRPTELMPRGVVLIDACLTALLVGGLLTLRRVRRERRERRRQAPADGTPVLIVGGAGSAEVFLRAIRSGGQNAYRPVGLLTDRRRMLDRELAGVPVVGMVEQAAAAAVRTGAQMVLLSAGELSGCQVRNIMSECEAANVAVRVVPDVGRIVSGQVDFRPQQVAIEDLLGRETVDMDMGQLRRWLGGRNLLVTGSCGSIGSEIARQLLRFEPKKLILVDRSENGQFYLGRELQAAIDRGTVEIIVADTTDLPRMHNLFRTQQPNVVFHAAAYKHVPLMEQHPGEAVKNIVGATRCVADLARRCGVDSFVMISTDKAVNPTSVMGCCKRVAELYVQGLDDPQGCRFVTVRFGNVLGSAGSVIPVFRKQIAAGGPLTVTHPDMTRFFMTIPEASQLVIEAGVQGRGGEIFVLDMGQPVRIMDLATDMVRLSGLEVGRDIEIQITGLRPGEKLYEELYADDEIRLPTSHPKILRAESIHVQPDVIRSQVDQLLATADGNGETIRQQLAAIIPSYAYRKTSASSAIHQPLRRAA